MVKIKLLMIMIHRCLSARHAAIMGAEV